MTFITFEGGEGSGKTTQSSLLAKAFQAAGVDCIITREPGGTKNAEIIRDLIIKNGNNWRPITELLLINAARYEHVQEVILPALKAGKVVICDRFVDSTMAYQGFGRKLGKRMPAILHNLLMEGVSPNLTFILEIGSVEGLKRSRAAGNNNSFEDLELEFHEKVRQGFEDIATMAQSRCLLIDATRNIKTIHKTIIEQVNNRFSTELKTVEVEQV